MAMIPTTDPVTISAATDPFNLPTPVNRKNSSHSFFDGNEKQMVLTHMGETV